MTRWLTEDELNAWLRLAGVMLKLQPALDSQLQRDSDMTHFDYLCLAMLSESDDRTRTMSDLAGKTNASLSRLSHVITKLEKRGFVSRCPSPVSRRVTLVKLTDDGWDKVVATAPGHVAEVRRLLLDPLSKAQVRQLATIGQRILNAIDPPAAT